MKLNEEIFKKAAEKYAADFGEEMLEKADKLNSQISSVPVKSAPEIINTAQKQNIRRSKKMRVALIAACSALAVIIPFSAKTLLNKNTAAPSETAYESAESAADSAQAASEAAPAQIPADSHSEEAASSANGGSSSAARDYKGAFSSQIINIEKKLPKSFKFIYAREDNGIAVAELEDGFGDTVTLTLSSAGENAGDNGALNEYELNGIYAYGTSKSDYSYLTYEKDGVKYEFTSKYGLSGLLDLASDLEG